MSGHDRENNYKKIQVDLTSSATVAHVPTTVTVDLQPDVGKIWEVISIFGSWPNPVGAGVGTHNVSLYETNRTSASDVHLSVEKAFGSTMSIRSGAGFNGDTEVPNSSTQQFDISHLGVLIASNDEPLTISYTNATDVDQTGTRDLVFVVKEYREAL